MGPIADPNWKEGQRVLKRTQTFEVTCPRCGKNRSIGYQGYMHIKAGRTQGFCRSCRAWRLQTEQARALQATGFYQVWSAMRERCSNPNNRGYSNYGGRGIKVCDRWQHFDNFVADMYPTYEAGLTIERLNVNADYEPTNCVWISKAAQGANKTNNRAITIGDRTQHLAAWLAEVGMNSSTYYGKISRGLDPVTILSTYQPTAVRSLTYRGKTQTVSKWGAELGIKRATIDARLQKGWSVEQALSRLWSGGKPPSVHP